MLVRRYRSNVRKSSAPCAARGGNARQYIRLFPIAQTSNFVLGKPRLTVSRNPGPASSGLSHTRKVAGPECQANLSRTNPNSRPKGRGGDGKPSLSAALTLTLNSATRHHVMILMQHYPFATGLLEANYGTLVTRSYAALTLLFTTAIALGESLGYSPSPHESLMAYCRSRE